MRMCYVEEERLQKSMYDLRKVRKHWREIDFDRKEQNDVEECLNNKHDFLKYNHSRRHKAYAGDNYY